MNTLDPKAARILLLDDDEFMLRLLFRMLAQLGYSQLFACDSGEKALQHIVAPEASVRPDLSGYQHAGYGRR